MPPPRVLTGMLRRWDDSQRFLSEQPLLICEETANYLILWCFRLHQEGVRRRTHEATSDRHVTTENHRVLLVVFY